MNVNISIGKKKDVKPSRNIPQHLKRAVDARDGKKCRNCGVETEFVQYDHIYPYDLGGPTTLENLQTLCPTCNTSKGNKITCSQCRHWFSPDLSKCPQCETKLPYSKRSQTFAGKLEALSERVGKVVILGGVGTAALVLLVIGIYVAHKVSSRGVDSDQAASVQQVVNQTFNVAHSNFAMFPIVVPPGAKNARIVGGFKLAAGEGFDFYVFDAAQFQRWSAGAKDAVAVTQRKIVDSLKVHQPISAGNYYLVFSGKNATSDQSVAAELYLKHD